MSFDVETRVRMTTMTKIAARDIRKHDVVTLPSGRIRRIQRADSVGECMSLVFFDPAEGGHVWLKGDVEVSLMGRCDRQAHGHAA